MSIMTITLYEGCRLTKKYNEVYNGRTTLDTYLATLTKKDVYIGEEIYFTNNGSISIDNETSNIQGFTKHGDRYNYMTIKVAGQTTRYCFVDNITIVDQICVINYTEDIWTNYALMNNPISFEMKNSIIAQAKGLTASTEYTASDIDAFPKQLPVSYNALGNPSFYYGANDDKELYCYVLVTATAYKSAQQGEYSARFINNYLLTYQNKTTTFEGTPETPLNTADNFAWPINNDTLNIINDLVTLSSVTSITYQSQAGFKYEILDIKLIPKTIGDTFFASKLNGDSLHDYGLATDFKVQVSKYDYSTGYVIYPFDSDISFKNLCVQNYSMYRSGSTDKYTYNGYNPTDTIKHTKTIRFSESDKIYGLGNYTRFIPLVWNGLDINYDIELNLNVNGNSITLRVDNQLYNVSDDFRYNIPFEVQTANATQQARIARAIGTFQNIMGIMSTGVSAGAGMISSKTDTGNAVSGTYGVESMGANIYSGYVGAMSSMISKYEANQQINQHSFTTNKAIHTEDITCRNLEIGGFREFECNPDNEKYVQAIIGKYGYLYRVLINDKTIFYTNATEYIRFETANVYGNFSQNIARAIETILINGVVLLTGYN